MSELMIGHHSFWVLPLAAAMLLACQQSPTQPASTSSPAKAVSRDRGVRPLVKPLAKRPPSRRPLAKIQKKKRSPLELTFVGDVIFGRYRNAGYDPIFSVSQDPFYEVKALLRSDLVIANLETPLLPKLPKISRGDRPYRFAASIAQARVLRGVFDAVSVANNHAFDMGKEGVLATPAILKKIGVVALGAAREKGGAAPRIQTLVRRGWKIGLIALSCIPSGPHRNDSSYFPFVQERHFKRDLIPVVRAAKAAKHDLVVVLLHWGKEYADDPGGWRRVLARRLIDAGAHLVIGHHPHVLQGIERHRGGLIAYSLGNFLFENLHDPARLGGILRVRIESARRFPLAGSLGPSHTKDGSRSSQAPCITGLRFDPTYITPLPFKHPRPAKKAMGVKVRQRMQSLSRTLKTTLVRKNEALVWQRGKRRCW
jgi:hypothetical protein